MPTSVEAFVLSSINDPDAPETDVAPVPVLDNQVQIVKLDAAPGVHGLRWTWD